MSSINVSNLVVKINDLEILHGVDFFMPENTVIGIVGESGSGKTTFVRSLMGILPAGGAAAGEYEIDGENVPLPGDEKSWGNVRGKKLGLIMQDPFTALDPRTKCGKQITAPLPKGEADTFDISAALSEVGLSPDVANKYPFELSGGMRQRVVIAAVLALNPEILVADEATSALDVIIQEEILDLIVNIHEKKNTPLIIITHDLRILSSRTKTVLVFKDGEIVERGLTAEVISDPQNPYTKELLEAGKPGLRDVRLTFPNSKELMKAEHLNKHFGAQQALDDVNIDIFFDESVAVVGESGSGKTTLARTIIGLEQADSGTITFAKDCPSSVQIVFQDPYSSLNPAMKIGSILKEALRTAGRPESDVAELLEMVEIPFDFASRRPAQLSGGQRQRIAIARALATKPNLLICDESVSALDVIIQRKIIDLLICLREKEKFSMLFISHDMNVVRELADRVYVMKDGKVVEGGDANDVWNNPQNEYTVRLLNARLTEI
ncbi:MAG: ABC transporter ATP-binding protein [Clostridiales Family XIII bacterium]|jgi:peptide/nickel transport system ATP-binding protein|nr:ABC transporter ATP-binding protein [Clostridiales Family XIII bacterium]